MNGTCKRHSHLHIICVYEKQSNMWGETHVTVSSLRRYIMNTMRGYGHGTRKLDYMSRGYIAGL